MSSRRKRSRLVDGEDDGSDADAADAVEATNQNSGGEGNFTFGDDNDVDFSTGDHDDDSFRDDQSVDTVDSHVADDGITEGDGLEIQEPPSIEHWRGMELDSDTNKFRFVGSNNQEAAKDIPEPDQYKKIRPRDTKRVRVSFANARQSMVSILKEEYDELYKTLDEKGIPKTIDGIYEHLFGDDSRLVQTLSRALSMEHYDIYKSLATFYSAAELGKPPKHLHDHPHIKYDDYMDQESLNAIWRKIEVAGKDGKSTYFWEDVEAALNEDCRDLFLRSINSSTGDTAKHKLRIALDDDKVHFQFSSLNVKRDKNHLCGMCGQMHVRTGVRGMTIDSAVSAATGFPLCFRVRRQGETERDNYNYMLRFMFQHRFTVGAARDVALSGIVFCSDRGYWKVPVMLLILGLSGTIFGTLTRSYWATYTYDQPKERRGKREMIDTNKGRSLFVAYGRWKDSLLKIMAYRSGTDQVSLAMNSDCDEDEGVTFELVFANNGDERWYKDETLSFSNRILKAFQPVDGAEVSEEDADNIQYHLTMLPVEMLTCADLDLVWFILRMFSFTSSSTEAALQHSAPYLPHEFPERASFENVLGYAGHDKLMNAPMPDDMNVDSTASDGANAPINAQLVSKMMKLMRRPTQQTVDDCANDARRQKTRLEKDHSILGNVGTTGATPLGRGKSKDAAANHKNYDDLTQRYANCRGNIGRDYKRDPKPNSDGFVHKAGTCDLCGQKQVTTFCCGCKRYLCFDKDRSSKILAQLQHGNPARERLLRENPFLKDLSRGNVPPYYKEVGEVNGQPVIQGQSCYHIAHPKLCQPCNTNEQEDDQLAMIVASSSSASDASPLRAH